MTAREPWQTPQSVKIDKGSAVVDRDGHEIGVVEDLRLQAGSDRLEGFDVRLGGGLRALLPEAT